MWVLVPVKGESWLFLGDSKGSEILIVYYRSLVAGPEGFARNTHQALQIITHALHAFPFKLQEMPCCSQCTADFFRAAPLYLRLYWYEGKGKKQHIFTDMCRLLHCAAVPSLLQGALSKLPVSPAMHYICISFKRPNQQHKHRLTVTFCYDLF